MKTTKKSIRKLMAVILAMMVVMQLVCINAFAAGEPAVPTGLSAVPSDGKVTLTWNLVTDAISYTINYGDISGKLDNYVTTTATSIVITTLTDTNKTPLTNNVKYYFAVCANNGTTSSAYSTPEKDARPLADKLDTPTFLKPTPGDCKVELDWPDVYSATYYMVSGWTTDKAQAILFKTKDSGSAMTVDGLINGTTYHFAVCAYNDTKSGDYTTLDVSATPHGASALDVPTGLIATAGDSQVQLTWTVVSGAKDYTVKYWTTDISKALTVNTPDSGSAMTVESLINETTYYFAVRANNGDTHSAYTPDEVTAKPEAATQYAAPTGLTVTPDSKQVTLNWTAPSAAGVTSYTVSYGTTPGALSSTTHVNSTSAAVTGLIDDTTYYFAVRANYGSNVSAYTAEISAKPTAASTLTIPTSLTAVGSDGKVTLDWDDVDKATSYIVKYGTAPDALISTSTSNLSTIAISCTNGTTYYFAVCAKKDATTGAYTTVVSATPSKLPVPTGLTAVGTDGKVTLDWADVTGATGYTVKYGTSSGSLTSTAASTASTIAISCTNGTTYYFAVCAKNATATSAYTSVVSATPSALTVPTGLTAVGTNGKVTLDWVDVTGATGYTIKYGKASGSLTSTATSTASTITISCTNGTTYYFAVCAKNATATGAYTAVISATPSAKKNVSYNSNGSTGGAVPATVSIETGKTATVSGNTGFLVKTDFKFAGWNTKADGTGTSYQAGATITVMEDIVLFAKWSSGKKIVYNGDSWAANGVDDYIVAYRTSDQVIVPTSYLDAGKSVVPYATPTTGTYAAKNNFIGFDDIKEGYWASKYIWFLSAREVMQGAGNHQFTPQGILTRAEFIKILACLTPGNDTSAAGTSGFSDVAATDWFAPYVNWGVKQGIAAGYGNGKFGPHDAITREQMCVMLSKYCDYLGYSFGDINVVKTFNDAGNISSWATVAVNALQESGFMGGQANNMFAPKSNSTRAEAATVTCKFLKGILSNMENPKEIKWVS